MFDFTPFRLFQKFGVSRYINPNFDIELISKWGHTGFCDYNTDKDLFKVGVKNLNGLVSYKFIGGKNFRPYLKAGLGLVKYNVLDNVPGQDATNLSVPVGLGFDYEFSKLASFDLQAVYGFNFGDTFDKNTTKDGNGNYFNPSIRLKVHFGGKKDIDGDADKLDVFPNVPGLVQFS